MDDFGCLWAVRSGTPLGTFVSVLDDGGVMAAGFVEDAVELRSVMKISDRELDIVEPGADLGLDLAAQVREAVEAYFAGSFEAVARIPLSAHFIGGRGAAWKIMRSLAPGATITARQLMNKTRNLHNLSAVEGACEWNPAALYIPSHRVVEVEGDSGGFRYGLARKEWLLAHERATGAGVGAGES